MTDQQLDAFPPIIHTATGLTVEQDQQPPIAPFNVPQPVLPLIQTAVANAPQNAIPSTLPNLTPMSRTQEQDKLRELDLGFGSQVRIVWRRRETLDTFASPWEAWMGVISLIDEDHDGHKRWTVDYERPTGPETGFLPAEDMYEVASIERIKTQGKPIALMSLKRAREETTTLPPGNHETQLASSIATALTDASRGKLTAPVPNGDGLKIPKTVPDRFYCTYPPLWFARIEAGGSKQDISKELVTRWSTLREHLGATFRYAAHRDSFSVHVDNIAASVFITKAPESKARWRTLFANVFGALSDIVTVSQGAKQASTFVTKAWDQFNAGNLDIEECLRLAEVPEPPSDNKAPVIDTRALQAQLTALSAKNQSLEQQLLGMQQSASEFQQTNSNFRGRGRGYMGRRGGRAK